eukprot:7321850-Alexandrium_andersonii.AAC.1
MPQPSGRAGACAGHGGRSRRLVERSSWPSTGLQGDWYVCGPRWPPPAGLARPPGRGMAGPG